MCVRWELYNEWRLPHCIVRIIGCPSIHFFLFLFLFFFFTWDQRNIQYILYCWIDGFSILNLIPKIIDPNFLKHWEYAFVSSKSSRIGVAPVIRNGWFWSGCVVFFGCVYCFVLCNFVMIKNGWLWSGCESHNF